MLLLLGLLQNICICFHVLCIVQCYISPAQPLGPTALVQSTEMLPIQYFESIIGSSILTKVVIFHHQQPTPHYRHLQTIHGIVLVTLDLELPAGSCDVVHLTHLFACCFCSLSASVLPSNQWYVITVHYIVPDHYFFD